MPKFWAILGTIAASGAFLSAKLFLQLSDIRVSQTVWFGTSLVFIWLAIICGVIYILTRLSRTITFAGKTQLAGSPEEYLPTVANDPQNAGKTSDELMSDAAGVAGDVWTAKALNKSRRILGIEYTVFISLLAFGVYLGIEAYNAPKPDPTFAEQATKLKDVHFELDKSDLNADATDLLKSDAAILEDIFKSYKNATVILEGYCDDRGGEGYNFVLGSKRAEAVKQALLTFHIQRDKIAVSSRGKKESTCQASDEPCRQKDRRVHLTVIQN
jgi:outer membrane protein OmpA-like peptidoglycan-associated protein